MNINHSLLVALPLILIVPCHAAWILHRRQVVSGLLLFPWWPLQENASAADSLSSTMFQPATPDRPQIPLPVNINKNDPSTVIEALLYYKNPRSNQRPLATDSFLITARDSPNGNIVAAAKIPVGKVALPLRFTVSEANAIDRDAFLATVTEKDLWLEVQVCATPTTTTKEKGDRLSCSSSQSMMKAQGVAKLIRFEDNSVAIRAPASLALE